MTKMRAVVVMTTLTRPSGEDNVRLELACELAERARAGGHIVLVAEKNYNENQSAVARLKKHGARVTPQLGKTPGEDRRALFKEAQILTFVGDAKDIDGVLWTEEKPYMADELDNIIERMRSRGAVALIPGRTPQSWQTWPWLQQQSEPIANKLYNRLFFGPGDGPYDPMHGPCYFGHEVIPDVLDFDPTKYGLPDIYIQHFVPIVLMAKGLKVTSLNIRCSYPTNQRFEENGSKFVEMVGRRVSQLDQITKGHIRLYRELFSAK